MSNFGPGEGYRSNIEEIEEITYTILRYMFTNMIRRIITYLFKMLCIVNSKILISYFCMHYHKKPKNYGKENSENHGDVVSFLSYKHFPTFLLSNFCSATEGSLFLQALLEKGSHFRITFFYELQQYTFFHTLDLKSLWPVLIISEKNKFYLFSNTEYLKKNAPETSKIPKHLSMMQFSSDLFKLNQLLFEHNFKEK